MPEHPVILFDGYCNLCSGAVVFVLKREPGDVFRFASLQSAYADQLLQNLNLQGNPPDSIVLEEGGRTFFRSTAALRIAKRMRRLWPLLYGLIIIPRFIRDPVYDWIARNRYRWFGKRNTCFMPSREMSHKFYR